MVAGCDGEFVPWAGSEAIIAAINPVSEFWAQRRINGAFVLNCKVGNAFACIQLVGGGKGIGWADVEAGTTRAAMVNLCAVGGQFKRGVNAAKERPIAPIAAHEICVLTLPTQSVLTLTLLVL